VDPTLEFLKIAVEKEKSTPGGLLNLVGMGLFAIGIAATGTATVLGQTFGFLFSLADLLRYGFDRVISLIEAKLGAPATPIKPPQRYQVPRIPTPKSTYVMAVGVLLIACPVALVAAGKSGDPPSQSSAKQLRETPAE